MKIETKFNLGHEVYMVHHGQVTKATVIGIEFTAVKSGEEKDRKLIYTVGIGNRFGAVPPAQEYNEEEQVREWRLHRTKRELLLSLGAKDE